MPAGGERRAGRRRRPRTPEEAEVARILAEADAALRSGETTIKLDAPRPASCTAGMQRFDTLTTGPGIDRVTFALDGKPVLTKRSPPFSVELDLGVVPRTRTLAVTAYDAQGNALAARRDARSTPPATASASASSSRRRGSATEASLLARAEVDVPEEETLERVELYLNEARIATLYQPPWVHPVVLPPRATAARLRAGGRLSRRRQLDRERGVRQRAGGDGAGQRRLRGALRHGARPPGASGHLRPQAQDFAVAEDGVRQHDRPLRAGDRPADPRRDGDRRLGLDGAQPGAGAERRPPVPPGDDAPARTAPR